MTDGESDQLPDKSATARDDALDAVVGPEQVDWTAAWRRKVLAQRQQIELLPDRAQPSPDFWEARASFFTADPYRSADPILDRLLALIEPDWTCLDVGAGGGRYALPLALRCRRVTAVEPSPGMRRTLSQEVERYDVRNIDVVASDWMGASADIADLVLCSHVLYDIEDIASFLGKLSEHARRWCVVVIGTTPPGVTRDDLWPLFRGQQRLQSPVYWDLTNVLLQQKIYPDVEMITVEQTQRYGSLEEAVSALRWRLWFAPDPERDAWLRQYVQSHSEERDGQIHMMPPRNWTVAFVRWAPQK